jgi:hypothetical protein
LHSLILEVVGVLRGVAAWMAALFAIALVK